jgi:hypothetical protein
LPKRILPVVANLPQLPDLNPNFAILLNFSDATADALQQTLPVLARQYKVVVLAWPIDLVNRVQAAVSRTCEQPSVPEFQFKLLREAAEHNAEM